ncbi:hypothetical protein M9Y10_023453 [Tritrichomonas musculus]|uniref:Protein kinase domain-containing protein n=1 Tax=Tritrichomonas musculus TaxID=1915356 RepID=A0ABR2KW32_9EUKA
MWVRQPPSPRRNYQSHLQSNCSTSLPKLFLQPITNPIFSGKQASNSSHNSFHRSLQLGISNTSSPSIRPSKFSISTDINCNQTEFHQHNYKFSSKILDELSFENGKPYTSSFILYNCRNFLTPPEEKEIKKYPEIFFLRRKPKKKKLACKPDKHLFSERVDYEINNVSSKADEENGSFVMESNFNEDSDNKNKKVIYTTIKSKIYENSDSHCKFDKISNDCNSIAEDEFPVGDHIAYRFEILSKLGSGAFGTVLKCYDHKLNNNVALKMIKETHESHPGVVLEAKFLENLQNGCKQHHIVELYESFTFRNYFCISMELVITNFDSESIAEGKNSNEDNEQKRPQFSNSDLLQLFDAINFIHSNGILHCDLKPSNILFSFENKSQMKTNISINKQKNTRDQDNFNSNIQPNLHPNFRKGSRNNRNFNKILKIIDFGCSCFLGQCPYEKIQSLNYRAPEVVLRLMPYTTAIDIWSIGCIIFEVTVGSPLFNSNSELELINEIVDLIGEPPHWMMEESSKKSKFFTEINGQFNVKTMIDRKQSIMKNKNFSKFTGKNFNDDDLIKNYNDYNIKSPTQFQTHSVEYFCNDDLIKNYNDLNKSQSPHYSTETTDNFDDDSQSSFKICSPSSKNTTVRKNKKSNVSTSTLKARVSKVGSHALLSLLEGCLTWDPNSRMTAEQLINHPWSKSIK